MKKLLLLISLLLATNAWGEYVGLECKPMNNLISDDPKHTTWLRIDIEEKKVLMSGETTEGKLFQNLMGIIEINDKEFKFKRRLSQVSYKLDRMTLRLTTYTRNGSFLFDECEKLISDEYLLERRDKHFEDIILKRQI
jgi:hypothetical protein